MTPNTKIITKLLLRVSQGDKSAVDKLFPLVYNELRRMSRNQLKGERKHHTINATALVHEAYIRFVGKDNLDMNNRAHFFCLAAKSMREILIDYARKRRAAKRGGDQPLVTFDEHSMKREARAEELIELDDMLKALQSEVPRASQIVELKFFGGLTYDEIANVLSISVPTVRRDWRFAQAWLGAALRY